MPAASASPTTSATPTPVPVTVDQYGFHPSVVHIYSGQSVLWTNGDKRQHTATAADGSWDTGPIDGGQNQALQFFETGHWDYLDGFNPSQHATLIVATPAPAL